MKGSRVRNKQQSNSAAGIAIKGEGRDEWGNRYFKLAVRGSEVDLPPFSMKQISSDPDSLYNTLSNAGLNIFTRAAKNAVLELLQTQQQAPSVFNVVTRLGWNSGAFVLPGTIIGYPSKNLEPSFRHLSQQLVAKYRVKGSLHDWQQKIGRFCCGNSRLMFCASLGLTGPILPLVSGPRSGGFQLFGPRESGKTAAAMVTGSIWGCHQLQERRENGFVESWHTTAGKIEITALAHNETVLILDETFRAGRDEKGRGQAVLDISFGLAEHVERERLTNTGPIRGWRFYFLSTSNRSLSELAQGAGIEIDDAQRGRFVDVPNPNGGHGIYEDMHQFGSGERFTDTLKIRCRKYCGAVSQEFVRKLVEERDREPQGLKRFLNRERSAYLQAIKARAEADGLKPLHRASGRFATVFAAGSLAIRYGIFRWQRNELLRAVLSCQVDGLRHDLGDRSRVNFSVSGLRRKLVTYLCQHRKAFRNLDKDMPRLGSHKFGSAPGYFATFKGRKWFYLTADELTKIIGTGENAVRLKQQLVMNGLLATTGSRYVVQRPIFAGAKGNKGHKWVHAFRVIVLKNNAQD